MNRGEAELILFWRQFLAGEMPPLVRGLRSVSAQAAAALTAGLTRVAVRYLLEQGGAHPDVSLANDRRSNQRALWTEPVLALDFRPALFDVLAHLARAGMLPAEATGELGSGGEVVLLMIADELASRPRADLLLATVTKRGSLAWLAHGGPDDRPFPEDATFEDSLFFVRGRLARAWPALDPVLATTGTTLHLMLERADQRAMVWARYRELVLRNRRFELLAPLCAAATSLWAHTDADRLLARVEEIGRFAGESPRQDAYRRLLGCYQWLADLQDWAAQARAASPYDDEDFRRWQVYLAYYGRMPETAHVQSGRLTEQLRRTL
jgi:hypothetical protein